MAVKKTSGPKAAPSRNAVARAAKVAPSKTRKPPAKSASTEAARGGRSSTKGAPEFETRPGGLVVWHGPAPAPGVKKSRMPSKQQIAEMIEEATVDAYGDVEQAGGWHVMISDNLELPFATEVLGVEVQVVEIDVTSRNEIVAVCRRGQKTVRLPLLDLELPDPPPEGFGWIEAYRQWCG